MLFTLTVLFKKLSDPIPVDGVVYEPIIGHMTLERFSQRF